MPYVPFSLRYRPQTFADIIGQEHVSRTLQNAVASGRVVHAYLFAGPRGTGKTSTARVLAKALLCDKGPTPEPCGECSLCRAITDGRALDVIEIDAASNRGIEQIRELREKVRYSPAEARAKVYILDEVHMLTPEAFNALLKTLEEPPGHAYFVLATTELHRVPPTIISRCQLFEFHLIGEARIEAALQAIAGSEGVQADPEALQEIARAARGSLRDAESIFDQAVAYAGGRITVDLAREVLGVTPRDAVVDLLKAMAENDLSSTLSRLDELVASGKDLPQLLQDIMLAVRDMLRASLGVGTSEEWEELADPARDIGSERLAETLRLLGEAERRLRDATQQQVSLELSLAQIAQTWAQPSAREKARAMVTQPRQAPTGPAPRRLETPAAAQPRRSATVEAASDKPSKAESEPEPASAPKAAPSTLAPAASSSASQGPSPVSADELAARWEEVHLQLKRMRRVAVWALLQEAKPVSLEGDIVTIQFDPKWKFHSERLGGPYRADVEQALSRVLGRPVQVRCLLGDVLTTPTPAPASQASKPKQEALPTAIQTAEAEDAGPQAEAQDEKDEKQDKKGIVEEPESEASAAAEKTVSAPKSPSQSDDDAIQRAVELTLQLFEDSEELPPE